MAKTNVDLEKTENMDELVENVLVSRGKTMYYGAINDANYLILMAVKACTKTVGRDFFNKISIVDFERIKNRARFFLAGVAQSKR